MRRASEATNSHTNTYPGGSQTPLQILKLIPAPLLLSLPGPTLSLLSSQNKFFFPSLAWAVQCNMLLLICNNTWQGQINSSYGTRVPEAHLTGDQVYITRVTLHYLYSPAVMGTFFFLKGQLLTSVTQEALANAIVTQAEQGRYNSFLERAPSGFKICRDILSCSLILSHMIQLIYTLSSVCSWVLTSMILKL